MTQPQESKETSEMTIYIAAAQELTHNIATETFTSLAKAKAWARKQSAPVVIADQGMPSRYIKRIQTDNGARWVGQAPDSWFNA